MAGGTGGHVFPALAVAKVLRERGVAVVWLGVPGSMESRLVPANGFPIEWVRVARHSRQGSAAWLRGAVAHRCNAVVAGHARAAPGAAALGARRRRLRERPGRHRRVAAAHSAADSRAERHRRLDQSLAGAHRDAGARSLSRAASAPGVQARTIGNPVRADIAALPAPAARFAGRDRRAAPAGVRRQPGCAAPERRGAAGAGALRSGDAARRSAIRPASADWKRRAPPISRRRSRRRCCPSSTTWPRPMRGRIWPCAAPAP